MCKEAVAYLEARKEEVAYLEAFSAVNSERCLLLKVWLLQNVWLLQEEWQLQSQLQEVWLLEHHHNNKCNRWHKLLNKWHKLNHNYLVECLSHNRTSKCKCL